MHSRRLLFVPLLAAALLYTPAVLAQGPHSGSDIAVHGVPASVTSYGFGGGRGFHGVPASVTSPNFGRIPSRPHPVFALGEHHRHHAVINPFYGGVYYAPYGYPGYVMEPGPFDSMETDYAAPPVYETAPDAREQVRQELNDLRASVEDYRDELRSERKQEPQPEAQQPAPDQPTTVLVFRDGHQLEIANYAIVGGTLYDLSEGRTKKVELAQLDLPATVKQNDARGVAFQLPAGIANVQR